MCLSFQNRLDLVILCCVFFVLLFVVTVTGPGGDPIYSYFIYIPTSISPADGPSRCQEIPLPLGPLPDWWKSAVSGDFSDLDMWLESLGADPWMLSGIPNLEEVQKSGPRELRHQKKIRKKAHNSNLQKMLLPQ